MQEKFSSPASGAPAHGAEEEFARLGVGTVAYVRELNGKAARMLRDRIGFEPKGAKVFVLYAADGWLIAVADEFEELAGFAKADGLKV